MPVLMIITQGRPEDLPVLQELFVNTISTICRADYDDEQIRAWTSGVENPERWRDLLSGQYLIVAREQEQVVGFASLDGNYLDFLYVHHNHQRKGIAQKLYAEVEREAKRQRQNTLSSDVSITARPFFERMGFQHLKTQRVNMHGIELVNYKMMKHLSRE